MDTDKIYDVIIIGGGASGMTAALAAQANKARVLIIERNAFCGKKLLSTGNGRCNFTNANITPEAYGKKDHAAFTALLEDFGTAEALCFFKKLGVIPMQKDGGYYPYTNRAKDVLACFEATIRQKGIPVLCGDTAEEISYENTPCGRLFFIRTRGEEHGMRTLRARRCILATGGMAAPKSGSDGAGYTWARDFGHTLIPAVPALVRLRCERRQLKKLAGLRVKATVRLSVDGQMIREEYGEVQMNADGLSGIPVMDVSGDALAALSENKKVYLLLDLFPPEKEQGASMQLIKEMLWQDGQGKTVGEALRGLLASEIAHVVLSEAGIGYDTPVKKVRKEQMEKLYDGMRRLAFLVCGSKGFEAAQTTKGGIPLDEIDVKTFASKKQKGLYLCGELLDVDGICGGYNLHFAWASGYFAGKAAAKG